MKRLTILAMIVSISGCSNYEFTSNIDKKNFDEYFKPSQVTIYEKAELLTLKYTTLGAVEGSSCQQTENDLPANIKDARTKARINAAEMHANGIVFQTCLNFERDKTCVSNIICYGRAIHVVSPNND
jgi:RcsF protein